MRPALCEDALRLGRILAELAPRGAGGPRPRRADGDPGVALRARASARRASRSCCSTRTARAGTSCSSAAASRRSSAPRKLGGALGPYALQAAIAACHARARTAEETDWARIAALYDALAAARAVAGRRAEPRGRGRDGVRPGGGPRARRRADVGAVARGLPPAAERARRPAREARPRSTRRARSSSARHRSRATRASARCCSSAPPRADQLRGSRRDAVGVNSEIGALF